MRFGHRGAVSSSSFRWVIALAALTYLSQPILAADYYVDPNYAGVNGAPYNGYAGAYNTVAAALGSSGIPSGASAANPNRLFFAPGVYNTANVTGVSLSNSRNNIALIGLTNNPDDVVITST